MAFWDRFTKQKKKSKRHFTGTNSGRLFNDWKASSSSPDAELVNLNIMRNRTRDLAGNNPIVQRYFQILNRLLEDFYQQKNHIENLNNRHL